jgi:hypothetical protein
MGTVVGVIILGSILAFLTIGSSALEEDLKKLQKHKH